MAIDRMCFSYYFDVYTHTFKIFQLQSPESDLFCVLTNALFGTKGGRLAYMVGATGDAWWDILGKGYGLST